MHGPRGEDVPGQGTSPGGLDGVRLRLVRTAATAAGFADDVRRDLVAAGLRVEDAADAVGDAAVLLAPSLGEEIRATLRSLARPLQGRVLVVLPDRSPLVDGAVWDVLAAGAADVLTWHAGPAPVLERLRRWAAVDALMRSDLVAGNIAGTSPAFRAVLREVLEIGRFTQASVLVTGESGTGKELVARLIHALDPARRRHDLVVVDCTTIVPALSGSEFFGHERGAFTGAVAPREGAFALADRGTLFLDEVGELPPPLQAELLRVVQEGSYKPVGSNRWRRTDFRLVCATNRDLLEEEARGQFRRDFYFRIAQWRCHLPPLADRPEDILPLARHFLAELAGGDPPDLDPAVREFLLRRPYPGNVRDLRQLMARLHAAHVGPGPITAGEVPAADRPAPPAGRRTADVGVALDNAVTQALDAEPSLKALIERVRVTAIDVALEQSGHSVARAARRLGITERALQMHLRKARLACAGTDLAHAEAGDT